VVDDTDMPTCYNQRQSLDLFYDNGEACKNRTDNASIEFNIQALRAPSSEHMEEPSICKRSEEHWEE
jgi:hypothetical protein